MKIKSRPVIRVTDLWKQFEVTKKLKYITLRDSLWNMLNLRTKESSQQMMWALRQINFEVNQGEVVGIIGRNGAGKSTLLKILSRVTVPTRGEITIRGRVGSLLEIGTGFHQELTGRENIYLNGSILGMTRREITDKYSQIVEFSEIGKFMETPVKHYSSGMQMRLAFSVAAYLDPEIMMIDEILAVGDLEFQKKCFKRVNEVARSGRTVLIVSHNMSLIKNYCSRCVYLDKGKIISDSQNIQSTISKYLNLGSIKVSWINKGKKYDNPYFFPLKIATKITQKVADWPEVILEIEGKVKKIDTSLQVGYSLYAEDGTFLFESCHTDQSLDHWPKLAVGLNILQTHLPSEILRSGNYHLELIVARYHKEWFCEPQVNSPVIEFSVHRTFSSHYVSNNRRGTLLPILEWGKV